MGNPLGKAPSFVASVPTLIAGKRTAAVFDTGCSSTAITLAAVARLGLRHLIVVNETTTLPAVGIGEPVQVAGHLTTDIVIGTVKLEHVICRVLRTNGPFELLIRGECQWQISPYTIRLEDPTWGHLLIAQGGKTHNVPYGAGYPRMPVTEIVRAAGNQQIPAASSYWLECRIEHELRADCLTVFTPKVAFWSRMGLACFDQFVLVDPCRPIFRVLTHNHLTYPVTIYNDTRVGTLEKLDNRLLPPGAAKGAYTLQEAPPIPATPDYTPEEKAQVLAELAKNSEPYVHLTEAQRQAILDVSSEYIKCFTRHEFDLGYSTLLRHEVDTGDSKPQKGKPFYLGKKMEEIMGQKVESMLKAGLIRPSTSAWLAGAFLVKKSNGDWRFVQDYREANKVTRVPATPLPTCASLLDKLGQAKFYGLIDLQNGRWAWSRIRFRKQPSPPTANYGNSWSHRWAWLERLLPSPGSSRPLFRVSPPHRPDSPDPVGSSPTWTTSSRCIGKCSMHYTWPT